LAASRWLVEYTLSGERLLPELQGKECEPARHDQGGREKKVPALDDEMAKDTARRRRWRACAGKLRERLLEVEERRINGEMSRALIKELVKRNEFAVAPALIDRYAQLIVNRAKQQLMMMGVDTEGVDDAKMRDEMRAEAERGPRARSSSRRSPSARAHGHDADRAKADRRAGSGAQREPEAAARRAGEGPPHPPDREPDPRTEGA
jgi:hypothetical protein